ncbi:hypothetical protein BH20ACT17_BH20ACT17_19380 [soil metagenome]
MDRRVFSVLLAVLLCAAGLAAVAAIELMPFVSGWIDAALVAGVLVTMLLPAYLIVRPPDFRDQGDDDPGGGKGPPPTRPEPPGPDDGLPDPDWSSFDDLRTDWERQPVGA